MSLLPNRDTDTPLAYGLKSGIGLAILLAIGFTVVDLIRSGNFNPVSVLLAAVAGAALGFLDAMRLRSRRSNE